MDKIRTAAELLAEAERLETEAAAFRQAAQILNPEMPSITNRTTANGASGHLLSRENGARS